ncbi:MAG TPA: hypothetical protein VJU16_03595 [Planctomycetota bacterium]|nr:hypothetical protein [Planctomycetota bacterium]
MARGQGELKGIREPHIVRLEEIEDRINEIDEKLAKLKDEKGELSDEACGIWVDKKLEGVRQRGADEWYMEKGENKYKRRRTKGLKKGSKKKGAEAGALEKATA